MGGDERKRGGGDMGGDEAGDKPGRSILLLVQPSAHAQRSTATIYYSDR